MIDNVLTSFNEEVERSGLLSLDPDAQVDFDLSRVDELYEALTNWREGRRMADRTYHRFNRTIETMSSPPGKEACWFITVNPDTTKYAFSKFKTAVERFAKSKTITDRMYVYEQRGSVGGKPIGTGYHMHMLLYTPVPRSLLSQRLKQCFVNCLIDVPLKPTSDTQSKIDYMNGIKALDKMPKVHMDSEWRSTQGVQDIYPFQHPTCVENPPIDSQKLIEPLEVIS